jgi:hypothetical protein
MSAGEGVRRIGEVIQRFLYFFGAALTIGGALALATMEGGDRLVVTVACWVAAVMMFAVGRAARYIFDGFAGE